MKCLPRRSICQGRALARVGVHEFSTRVLMFFILIKKFSFSLSYGEKRQAGMSNHWQNLCLCMEIGSKWPKTSIVEVSAGEKSGFYINAILKSQIKGLRFFANTKRYHGRPLQSKLLSIFARFSCKQPPACRLRVGFLCYLLTQTRVVSIFPLF